MAEAEDFNKAIDVTEEALAFIKNSIPALDDEKMKEYYNKVLSSLGEAHTIAHKPDNKLGDEMTFKLADATVRYATQVAFYLFQHDLFTDELTEAFRKLPKVETYAEYTKRYDEARKAEIARIGEEQKAVLSEQRELEVFTAVIAGYTEKEAKKRIKEYEQKSSVAM